MTRVSREYVPVCGRCTVNGVACSRVTVGPGRGKKEYLM